MKEGMMMLYSTVTDKEGCCWRVSVDDVRGDIEIRIEGSVLNLLELVKEAATED
jgi:hypothetical protein